MQYIQYNIPFVSLTSRASDICETDRNRNHEFQAKRFGYRVFRHHIFELIMIVYIAQLPTRVCI